MTSMQYICSTFVSRLKTSHGRRRRRFVWLSKLCIIKFTIYAALYLTPSHRFAYATVLELSCVDNYLMRDNRKTFQSDNAFLLALENCSYVTTLENRKSLELKGFYKRNAAVETRPGTTIFSLLALHGLILMDI